MSVALSRPIAGPAGAAPKTTPLAALGALGIVYGDLGTSPLYTLQTILGAAGGHVGAGDAIGLLSLLIWSLIVIISVKYCLVVMRADNNGEGGILALMSLIVAGRSGRRVLVAMGLFGAALIYGDGIITPAISVLSAVEGVNVATAALKPYVMPIAVVILLALFCAQKFGTASIGRAFGPIMLVWFVVIGVLGAIGVAHHPAVLTAIDPLHAAAFLARHGWGSFLVLGGVFLAVTGGEALYADMGSIGRGPIRAAWYGIVLPALLLSYAGQTALLLDATGGDTGNPFFRQVPGWALYPMVLLATAATIIASQAIITGAYSLTRQGMQLGWFPGLSVRQTSAEEYGQIYVPFVNWTMMVLTIALTIGFKSSDRLSGAYGTAVSTTMLLTTGLLYYAMRERWKWSVARAGALAGLFLIIDLAFFGANLLKIADGGWIPLFLGVLIFTLMTTWRRGIMAMRTRIGEIDESPQDFLARMTRMNVPRVAGTAVFLTRAERPVSPLIVRVVKNFGALHQTVVNLSARFEEQPTVTPEERTRVQHIVDGFWYVSVHYGFTEYPSLPAALALARKHGLDLDLTDAVWFAANDQVVAADRPNRLMTPWRRILFAFMYRNAVHFADRFALPTTRFLELGRQIEL